MSYCPECGTPLAENARFCPKCGHQVSKDSSTEETTIKPKSSFGAKAESTVVNETPENQRKKASGCKIAAMILGGLAVLGIVIIGGIFMLLGSAIKPLTTAADQHFALLKMGNDRAAYDSTAVEFRANTSYEDYQKFLKLNPVLRTITGSSFSNSKIDNGVGYLEGTLTAESGIKVAIVMQLQKELDEWKVSAYKFPETFE